MTGVWLYAREDQGPAHLFPVKPTQAAIDVACGRRYTALPRQVEIEDTVGLCPDCLRAKRAMAAVQACARCRRPVGPRLLEPARCGICQRSGLCIRCWSNCCEVKA